MRGGAARRHLATAADPELRLACGRLAYIFADSSGDGGWWTVGDGTTRSRLRDTKGLRYLAELVAHPHVQRHVLELVDVVEGTPTDASLQHRQLGDAGEVLDAAAKASYRLGGRDQWAASVAERARLNVTRALRTAIARVADVNPSAAGVLDRRIRTRAFCAYEPAPEDDVVWTVCGATSSQPS